jgi:hypothetical protein
MLNSELQNKIKIYRDKLGKIKIAGGGGGREELLSPPFHTPMLKFSPWQWTKQFRSFPLSGASCHHSQGSDFLTPKHESHPFRSRSGVGPIDQLTTRPFRVSYWPIDCLIVRGDFAYPEYFPFFASRHPILPFETCKSFWKLHFCQYLNIKIYKTITFRGPPLWSSGQSSWLQIRRPGFNSRHYPKKK